MTATTATTMTPVRTAPVWWLVCRQDLIELWVRGKALLFLIIYCCLLTFSSLLRQWESQLSLIPQAEILGITAQTTVSFALFIGLIIGADTISGERERETLEPLLLTPTSRRQIIFGKFLAALSTWPAALAIAVPYMLAMGHGTYHLGQSIVLTAVIGTLLNVGFTAFAMLVSMWSKSNKSSLFIALLAYLLVLIPTLWPGTAQKGDLGYLLQQLNPMQGTSHILEKVIINNRTIQEKLHYGYTTFGLAVLLPLVLIFVAAPRMTIAGGMPRLSLARVRSGRAATLLLAASIAAALALSSGHPLQAANRTADSGQLQIEVDLDHIVTGTGDRIEFTTKVTNTGTAPSRPFNVSMNIVTIGKGDPVDPEDWSPERSQQIDPLGPGASARQMWAVDTILEGNYMIYMTVVPVPTGPDTTEQTVSSTGIHVTVNPVSRTNPGGVLPVAIGMPLLLLGIAWLIRRRFRPGAAMPNVAP